jgi:hypothetical protein
VIRSQPSARSASGTALRPRLRSRKYLGGCSGCDTDRVLDLIAGQAELLGDRVDWLACPEQVDHVIDRRTAMGESRTSEAVVRIDGHVRDLVLRQADQLRVAVDREIDTPQVEIDDLGEDTLVVADDAIQAETLATCESATMVGRRSPPPQAGYAGDRAASFPGSR